MHTNIYEQYLSREQVPCTVKFLITFYYNQFDEKGNYISNSEREEMKDDKEENCKTV